MDVVSKSFNPKMAKEVGLDAAIIYTNIYFWCAKNRANRKHFYDGSYWTYNSARAFSELFEWLSEKQIWNCLKKLEKAGHIRSGNYNKTSYDRTKWYSVKLEDSIFRDVKMDFQTEENRNSSDGKPIPYINTDINTDIEKNKQKEILHIDVKEPIIEENTIEDQKITETTFFEIWNQERQRIKNKPSNLNRLDRNERNNLKDILEEGITKEELRKAVIALFKQEAMPLEIMHKRPNHLLTHFNQYLAAYEDKDARLYMPNKEVNDVYKA